MCNRRAIHTMIVELHYKLHSKIAASNLYCKITLVWLDSSLSVPTPTFKTNFHHLHQILIFITKRLVDHPIQ